MGFAYGFSDTRLIFSDGTRHRFRQQSQTLSFVTTLPKGLVLGAGLGPHGGGRIEGVRNSSETWTIHPGLVWAFTLGRRYFGTKPAIPYLLVLGTFSGSSTSTTRTTPTPDPSFAEAGERRGLHALDAKADLSVGWTLGDAFSPYLAVRAFGGPVFWRAPRRADGSEGARTTGSDLYHVSVACGFNLLIGRRGTAYFDAAFLGMRGLSGGAGFRF
ncbi:hypothetical protein PPSIR1_04573 [Plesiocystis pacifica SIR-1]|uniref:Outer membrane protein beta-barrel domain-containing protein n=1 Tax=Plesiocystis pacifica SIR-1 TaxID=391625 RepID=A6GBE4_9BACT|nr:hypothetical protein [Plesiocystis pacifica]EDM76853.1 hypothetical protein PPSIR1_04573 [Plesiocystis pacifica SIR-1]